MASDCGASCWTVLCRDEAHGHGLDLDLDLDLVDPGRGRLMIRRIAETPLEGHRRSNHVCHALR